jgi:glutathione-regulated potassium-efflux system ancillary protein KefF
MIVVIHAHPYPKRSRAGRALLDAIRSLPDIEIRSLYDLYPDFDIDAGAEQDALARSRLIVLLHPLYWYSVPGLMKHWFDKVLERGWAHGDAGTALAGKHCLWATTLGGDASTYAACGSPSTFCNYIAPLEQSARLCGLEWEEPFVVFDADRIADDALADEAARFRARVERFVLAPEPRERAVATAQAGTP